MGMTFKDRAKQTTIDTGSGALSLDAAVSGCTMLPNVGSNESFYYCVEQEDGSEWEVGRGYVSSGALQRGFVFSNHAGGSGFYARVNFSAGTKYVSLVAPAEFFSIVDNMLAAMAGRSFGVATVSTSDATPTALVVDKLAPAPNAAGGFRAAYMTGTIHAVSYGGAGAIAWEFDCTILSGAVTAFNKTLLFSDALTDCDVTCTTPFEFTVTGPAATDVDWGINLEIKFSRENGV